MRGCRILWLRCAMERLAGNSQARPSSMANRAGFLKLTMKFGWRRQRPHDEWLLTGLKRVEANRFRCTTNQRIGRGDATVYRFDVRTPEEYSEGHTPGFRNAPGGQLVQETDVFAPVRGALIVLATTAEAALI